MKLARKMAGCVNKTGTVAGGYSEQQMFCMEQQDELRRETRRGLGRATPSAGQQESRFKPRPDQVGFV